MNTNDPTSNNARQQALLTPKPPLRHPFRLRVNDWVRLDGRIGRVVRVTEAAAVVLVKRPVREFTTSARHPPLSGSPPIRKSRF